MATAMAIFKVARPCLFVPHAPLSCTALLPFRMLPTEQGRIEGDESSKPIGFVIIFALSSTEGQCLVNAMADKRCDAGSTPPVSFPPRNIDKQTGHRYSNLPHRAYTPRPWCSWCEGRYRRPGNRDALSLFFPDILRIPVSRVRKRHNQSTYISIPVSSSACDQKQIT